MQDWSVDHSPESDPEAPFVASPAAAGADDGGAATAVPAAATASSEPSSSSSARPEYVRDGTMQRGFRQGKTKEIAEHATGRRSAASLCSLSRAANATSSTTTDTAHEK